MWNRHESETIYMAPGQVHKDKTQGLPTFLKKNKKYFYLRPIHISAFNENLCSAKDFILNKFLYEPESHLVLNQFLWNIFFHFIHNEIIWALVRLVSNIITNISNIPCLPVIVFLLKFTQGNTDPRNINVFVTFGYGSLRSQQHPTK